MTWILPRQPTYEGFMSSPEVKYILKGLEHYTEDELNAELQRRAQLKIQEVNDAISKLEKLGYTVTK